MGDTHFTFFEFHLHDIGDVLPGRLPFGDGDRLPTSPDDFEESAGGHGILLAALLIVAITGVAFLLWRKRRGDSDDGVDRAEFDA